MRSIYLESGVISARFGSDVSLLLICCNINQSVQGGIALKSPPCNKKQTSGLTEKALSVYQTNCEMAVVKAAL